MVQAIERFQNVEAKQFKLVNTVWKDMIMDVFGDRLNSEAGAVSHNYEENTIDFESGGSITNALDRVSGNQEINHEYVVGNITLRPHIHWFQAAATKYVLTMRYRHQKSGQTKTTEWTERQLVANDGNDLFPYSSGTINQKTLFKSSISLQGVKISDTIQIQLSRTDSLGGTMPVYFFDLHAEVDALGSNTLYSKF